MITKKERLLAILQPRGLNFADLAKLCGKSRNAVSLWISEKENSQKPVFDSNTIRRLVYALGVVDFFQLINVFCENDLTFKVYLDYNKEEEKEDKKNGQNPSGSGTKNE